MKGCELCAPKDVLFESDFAYVCEEANPLSKGHVIVVPKRHVADFFDMSGAEQGSVIALLNRAQKMIREQYKPDGYNIGVNVGAAADELAATGAGPVGLTAGELADAARRVWNQWLKEKGSDPFISS